MAAANAALACNAQLGSPLPVVTAWEQFRMRLITFQTRRIIRGRQIAAEVCRQNGRLDNRQPHISTQAELDCWSLQQAIGLGLAHIAKDEAGKATGWLYYFSEHLAHPNMPCRPMPEGFTA